MILYCSGVSKNQLSYIPDMLTISCQDGTVKEYDIQGSTGYNEGEFNSRTRGDLAVDNGDDYVELTAEQTLELIRVFRLVPILLP